MVYMVKNEILYKGNVVGYRIVDENGIESDVSDYFLSFLVRDGFVNNARFAGKSRKKIVSLDGEFDKITCKLDNVRIPKSELTGGIEVCLCNSTNIEARNEFGILQAERTNDGYHINNIDVAFWGLGIGTALYKKFEGFVRGNNLGRRITANSVGPAMLRFWKKQGFDIVIYITVNGYVSEDPEHPEIALMQKILA